jgi:hypothetical protein
MGTTAAPVADFTTALKEAARCHFLLAVRM